MWDEEWGKLHETLLRIVFLDSDFNPLPPGCRTCVIALDRLCVLKCWLIVHMAGVIYCKSLPEAQSNIWTIQSLLSDETEATRLGHCGLRKMLDFFMECDLLFLKICNWWLLFVTTRCSCDPNDNTACSHWTLVCNSPEMPLALIRSKHFSISGLW